MYNLTPEMNLFKGQYRLKTVSLESGFPTKEVFLANTPLDSQQLFGKTKYLKQTYPTTTTIDVKFDTA